MNTKSLFGFAVRHNAYGYGVIKSSDLSPYGGKIDVVFSSVGKIESFSIPQDVLNGVIILTPPAEKAIKNALEELQEQQRALDEQHELKKKRIRQRAEFYKPIFEKYTYNEHFWLDILKVSVDVINYLNENYKSGSVPYCMAYEESRLNPVQKKALEAQYYNYQQFLKSEQRKAEEASKAQEAHLKCIESIAEEYRVLFEKYAYNVEIYRNVFRLSNEVISYLFSHYQQGSGDLEKAYKDPAVSTELRKTLRDYNYRKRRAKICIERQIHLQHEGPHYFLHNYIPFRMLGPVDDPDSAVTRKIWKYKDLNNDAITSFSEELLIALGAIADSPEYYSITKINLISIPTSKTDKTGPMKKSISMIVDLYRKYPASCRVELTDCSDWLVRKYDVQTSHQEKNRLSVDEHMDSIEFRAKSIPPWKYLNVIMDDVYTTGTQYAACKRILMKHGIAEDHIIGLMIGRTVSECLN